MRYLVFILLFWSCNPVKSVLNDPKKFDQVAEEVIRRGKCVNDTVTISSVKDSIIYNDSVVIYTEKIPCRDFDTTIRGARIRVSSGVLTYSHKDSVIYRTRTIKETVRDRKLEQLLEGDIYKYQSQLTQSRDSITTVKAEYKSYKADARIHQLKLWLLIVALVTFAFRKQILSLWKLFA